MKPELDKVTYEQYIEYCKKSRNEKSGEYEDEEPHPMEDIDHNFLNTLQQEIFDLAREGFPLAKWRKMREEFFNLSLIYSGFIPAEVKEYAINSRFLREEAIIRLIKSLESKEPSYLQKRTQDVRNIVEVVVELQQTQSKFIPLSTEEKNLLKAYEGAKSKHQNFASEAEVIEIVVIIKNACNALAKKSQLSEEEIARFKSEITTNLDLAVEKMPKTKGKHTLTPATVELQEAILAGETLRTLELAQKLREGISHDDKTKPTKDEVADLEMRIDETVGRANAAIDSLQPNKHYANKEQLTSAIKLVEQLVKIYPPFKENQKSPAIFSRSNKIVNDDDLSSDDVKKRKSWRPGNYS